MSKDRDIKIKISEDLPDMLIEIPPPIEYKPPTRLKSILFSTLASGGMKQQTKYDKNRHVILLSF
jgi:hypothetical protein